MNSIPWIKLNSTLDNQTYFRAMNNLLQPTLILVKLQYMERNTMKKTCLWQLYQPRTIALNYEKLGNGTCTSVKENSQGVTIPVSF